MSDIKKKIEVAAIAVIKCPSCEAEPGGLCLTIRASERARRGLSGYHFPTATHVSRLNALITTNLKLASGRLVGAKE